MLKDLFNILIPQCCLLVFILLQLACSIFVNPRFYKYSRLLSCFGISLSIFLLSTVAVEPQYYGFLNSLMSDNYTLLFHFMILLVGFFACLLTKNLITSQKQNSYTIHAILLTAILGGINIVSSNDFLTMFISIETMSFATYFLIGTSKGYPSKEAMFKYLITNAVASGVFLFGVSYMYGLTSSINLSDIYRIVIDQEPTLLYSFASIMIVLGLISKIALFPFANWILDVYKGTESSILVFLSTVPTLAIFGILCRLLVFPLSSTMELTFVVAFLAIITALWANVYAIRSQNIKEILACSSVANASYVIMAACLVPAYNLSTVIFYLICYVFMNIIAFGFLNVLEYNKQGLYLKDLDGLFHKNHGLVIAFVISIIALAGLPVTSGFVSKIYLFSAIANAGMMFLPFLMIILLLTVIGLFYYLKLLIPVFKHANRELFLNSVYSHKFVLYSCAIITVVIGICPDKIIELCKFIATNI